VVAGVQCAGRVRHFGHRPDPGAPDQGTFNGPGPVISLSPQSSSAAAAATARKASYDVYSSRVRQSLDIDLHTLSFGLKVSAIAGRVRIVGLGLAVNIADYDADYEELRLTVQRGRAGERLLREWHDNNSGTEVVPGFYLETMERCYWVLQWVGYVSGRYDWAGSVGLAKLALRASTWASAAGTLGLGVIYRFKP